MTLADFIEANTTTEIGRWFIHARCLSDEGTDPSHVGLLGWLGAYMNYLDRGGDEMSALRFEGGAEAVFAAMLPRIQGEVYLDSRVDRITLDPLLVHLEDHVREFDAVVLTVPPRALEPGFAVTE